MRKKLSIQEIATVSVVTALLCICAPFTIPIGPIPLSAANLMMFLGVYALGRKKATLSCFIYLCIGLIGIPVFSGFGSGPGKLFGPTGGYLMGYIFMVWIAGTFIDRFIDRIYLCIAGMLLGTLVLYVLGTIWLSFQAEMTFWAALSAGVLPFILGDLIKIVIAAVIGAKLRIQLKKSK